MSYNCIGESGLSISKCLKWADQCPRPSHLTGGLWEKEGLLDRAAGLAESSVLIQVSVRVWIVKKKLKLSSQNLEVSFGSSILVHLLSRKVSLAETGLRVPDGLTPNSSHNSFAVNVSFLLHLHFSDRADPMSILLSNGHHAITFSISVVH